MVTHNKRVQKEIPSRGQLLHTIKKVKTRNTTRDRALIALEYLTGARVSELLQVKRIQIEKVYKINSDFIQINNVPTLKRRKPMIRTVLIPVLREKDYLLVVLEYVNRLDAEQILFPMTRQRAWQIVHDNTGYFNHFFRHIRATHLTTDYGFTAQQLRQFFGWASSSMADNYSHLNMEDIARKMSPPELHPAASSPVTTPVTP